MSLFIFMCHRKIRVKKTVHDDSTLFEIQKFTLLITDKFFYIRNKFNDFTSLRYPLSIKTDQQNVVVMIFLTTLDGRERNTRPLRISYSPHKRMESRSGMSIEEQLYMYILIHLLIIRKKWNFYI